MRAYGATNFEEEKAAIVRACSEIKPDDLLRSLKAGEIYTELRSNASREVLNDGEVALACVGVSWKLLQHFSKKLRADRGFILEAVTAHGCALRYASAKLRGDKEVVFAAVKNDGDALHVASEELRGDKDVVLAAVNNDGFALRHASADLRGDKAFLLLAAHAAADYDLEFICRQALPSGTNALSKNEFCGAARSKLAVPGEVAPILTVGLSQCFQQVSGDEKAAEVSIRCEASLMSGNTFEITLQGDSSRPLSLNDLAVKLVEELPKHAEAAARVFINFRVDDHEEGETLPVTPWDAKWPLTDFLPTKSRVVGGEPPPKKPRA